MSIAKNPEKKDSIRRAQNKYFQANFKTVGCKLPKDLAQRFIDKAESDPAFITPSTGKGSANAALMSFIKSYLGE